ncbi:MAG: NAD(P)H-binding protein [Hyphomicrobium sp.]|nr:NAD(P)H-binding protein [Hyphomicrobium sp.]
MIQSVTHHEQTSPPRRILVLGGTGTIGRAVVAVLAARRNNVVCLVREGNTDVFNDCPGVEMRHGDVTDPDAVARDGLKSERFDAVISCLASRTGVPKDAWAIDYKAQRDALAAARAADVPHFILLSAICVQKPLLAFQRAKLAFEAELTKSGLRYSIVRPTAFFKSLSGQVERVRKGKPFLVFGDGTLTRCAPISDSDLANYIADCLDDPARYNRILPIGGPGPAITPRQQGEMLFALLRQPPRFRSVPVAMLDVIAGALGLAGNVVPALTAKAELARIGRYYATESMLVLDPETGRYDADATPQTGRDTLADFYARLINGEATAERAEHAVF